MTSKGQVTIPKAIRDRLNLRPGVTLHFSIDPTGRMSVTPLTLSLKDLVSLLPRPDKPVTIEEMNEAIADAAAESVMRDS